MSFPIPSQILPKTFQAIWDVFFMPIFATEFDTHGANRARVAGTDKMKLPLCQMSVVRAGITLIPFIIIVGAVIKKNIISIIEHAVNTIWMCLGYTFQIAISGEFPYNSCSYFGIIPKEDPT